MSADVNHQPYEELRRVVLVEVCGPESAFLSGPTGVLEDEIELPSKAVSLRVRDRHHNLELSLGSLPELLDEHSLLVHGQRPWPLLGFDFAQGLLSELCAQLPHLPLDMLTFDIQ